MTRKQRLRRIGILCCHFLRNLAFYKAGWRKNKLIFNEQFWVNANGNFLDICILEWCKLFGEKRGQHYWQKVITDQPAFLTQLLHAVGLTEVEFNVYIEEMRTYRNKFVAHLDEDKVANIPRLRTALRSAAYLYDHLRNDPIAKQYLPEAKHSASEFYAIMYRHAYQEYRRGI